MTVFSTLLICFFFVADELGWLLLSLGSVGRPPDFLPVAGWPLVQRLPMCVTSIGVHSVRQMLRSRSKIGLELGKVLGAEIVNFQESGALFADLILEVRPLAWAFARPAVFCCLVGTPCH